MSRHLLIIDPQNDFCDLPATHTIHTTPALPVPGANADMQRLAQLIERAANQIDGISITLDSHHVLDIAHPGFWQQADASPVAPFTAITAAMVRAGQYQPRQAAALPRVLSYLDRLEASARYALMVWPQHCVIGSWGHNVHADVQAACQSWQMQRLTNVNYVTKGENPWTEHYSAIQAEVPEADQPETQLNRALLELLAQQEQIIIAGEAGSHCVKATTEHILQHIGAQHIGKLVLLTDCISPVAGFEAQYQAFLQTCANAGVRLTSSSALLAEWQAAASTTSSAAASTTSSAASNAASATAV
jgi:nicotinamidase-related amidase